MKYFKENATIERRLWWNSLPEREQALRTCLFRLKKWDIPEHKTLLAYKRTYKGVDDAYIHVKANIRMFKLMAKALKRQLPVKSQAHFVKQCPNYGVFEWCCGHCQHIIPGYAKYCPYCGQRTDS